MLLPLGPLDRGQLPHPHRESPYGGTQCVCQFTDDALKAAGWAAIEVIAQAKFDVNMQAGRPHMQAGQVSQAGQALDGIGDAAAFSPSGGLHVRKGDTLVDLALNIDSDDPGNLDQLGQLRNGVIVQLARQAAGRIEP